MALSRFIFLQLRSCSTKTRTSALTSVDLIKNYNYENKVLYGSVMKEKKSKKVTNRETANNSAKSGTSSEMYWLLEHNHEMQTEATPKPKGRPKPERRNPPKTTTHSQVQSLGETLNDLRSNITPSLESVHQIKPATAVADPIEEIPFSNKGLKSILRFPLVAADVIKAPEIIAEYGSHYPSVGKILQSTLSDSARKSLVKWKLGKIQELGEDGFNQLQEATLTEGKMFHKSLENYFSIGITPESDSPVHMLWQSISPAIKDLQPTVEFTEKMIEHPFLKYRGVVDCVCTVNSEMTVIEWKKSEKTKNTIGATFDAPLQLCAYLGALTADPHYKLISKKGYVVVANTNGLPANIHQLDEISLKKYWQMWLQRLQEFWIRTRDGTLPEPI